MQIRRPSYLHIGISYNCKKTSSYWNWTDWDDNLNSVPHQVGTSSPATGGQGPMPPGYEVWLPAQTGAPAAADCPRPWPWRHWGQVRNITDSVSWYILEKIAPVMIGLHCRFNIRPSESIFKSPRYTGGDFMFLYRFVRRRRRRRPQILVHAITFEQLFGFLSFLAWLLALTYRLTD